MAQPFKKEIRAIETILGALEDQYGTKKPCKDYNPMCICCFSFDLAKRLEFLKEQLIDFETSKNLY
jgi:hypothetical protein